MLEFRNFRIHNPDRFCICKANDDGTAKCVCDAEGYEANDDGSCKDIDECPTVNCGNGKCANTVGSFVSNESKVKGNGIFNP